MCMWKQRQMHDKMTNYLISLKLGSEKCFQKQRVLLWWIHFNERTTLWGQQASLYRFRFLDHHHTTLICTGIQFLKWNKQINHSSYTKLNISNYLSRVVLCKWCSLQWKTTVQNIWLTSAKWKSIYKLNFFYHCPWSKQIT